MRYAPGSMPVALATTNQLAADAGRTVIDAGGNAVDAAVAAGLVTMISEPGVCAPGAGAYLTIAGPDRDAVTVDGNVEMPGVGAPRSRFGVIDHVAEMAYGGGVRTIVGYASVATPGALAALALALDRWGTVPWKEVLAPAIESARHGFPLSAAARLYLGFSHDAVFGWHAASRSALHDERGRLLDAGALVHVPGLADALDHLATEGVHSFYVGDVAASIAADFAEHGGILTRSDLAAYRPIVRPAAVLHFGDWEVATNPPPAVGGVALLAMLSGVTFGRTLLEREIVERQLWTWRHRRGIEASGSYDAGTATLHAMLAQAAPGGDGAPSTVHTSAVDAAGLSCAVTISAGYGSGLMPGGTGMWMNNALGEEELNPAGFHALRPGTRLGSNMAPTVVRAQNGTVLAIGSPGADRITSALQQTIARVLGGEALAAAVDAPRLHVELDQDDVTVAIEPGVDAAKIDQPVRRFDAPDMFFGGVSAAMWDGRSLTAAADPRRTGGTYISG